MPKSKPELTEAEWAIIKAVWENEPCTAPDIQAKLQRQTAWTYSTVRTIMDRMVVKGLLAAEKVRNLTIYRSAVTREQAQRGELFYALKHAFNGALTPMVQCLLDTANLSADELAELESFIKAKKKRAKKSANPLPNHP
jgi:BlaI family transcriptional regulator, penicillinase repressor